MRFLAYKLVFINNEITLADTAEINSSKPEQQVIELKLQYKFQYNVDY